MSHILGFRQRHRAGRVWGLAAQKARIADFVSENDEIIAEHVEVQSGKQDNREELWKAIAAAKRHSAKVLIAKLDRFSRKVSFISGIMEQGVGLVVADMPHASDFQLHIFAALAQEERRMISERTRAALAEAKRRGVVLGRNGAALAKLNHDRAARHARTLEPVIRPMLDNRQSYSAIARHLNALQIRTVNGSAYFPQTAKNVVRYLNMDT